MITQNYFTLPFYIPRICLLWNNWPEYLFNYILRRQTPTEYRLRSGLRVIDGTGTLPGTLAEVFVRRRYGAFERLRTIIDVGANVGSFALYAAQCCPEARIFCYEPEQQNFSQLKHNIRINALDDRVAAFRSAVGSCSGERMLALGVSQVNALDELRDWVNHRCEAADDQRRDRNHQTVACTTLREIRSAHQLDRLDLLKMNCEGAEYEIFESCVPADYHGILNIRLEYHNVDAVNRNGEWLRRYLEARGYKIERFTRRLTDSGFIWATRTR